jgi:site-specific DNA recombinase|nr:MAG TPA_asm: integrase [Caudoviricetes sp.]
MRIKVIKPTKAVRQQKKKVCAYVRVSTDSLQQEDSLENQTTYFKGFITANPEWEFVGIYSDQGISGYKENRPGFQKMIEDARAGNIDLIVVKSVSRFARNTETVLKFSRELKSIGVGIFFQLQNINTLSGAGELMLTVLAAFAQAESEGASDNAKMTYKRKFESGIPAHGLECTFGYKASAQGDIVVDEEKAAVVRQIFDLAEQGIWPSKIKQYLNKNGVPGCAGGDWDDTAVFRVLHNVSYKGDAILQKTYTDSRRKRHKNEGQVDQWYIAENHQPIVPPDQWDKVQEILQKRSEHLQTPAPPKPDKPRSSRNTYPLSNLIYCPICGEKLIHKWGKGKNEYWACKTNLKVGKDACKGIWLPAEVANSWGEITEPIVVVQYEDEYGMRRFTAYPKDEYDAFKRED